jgi:MFS family permease
MSWRQKSYEVLPALSVRGPELRRSLRTITSAWIFGVMWLSCIAGSRVTIFGRMLGFDDRHFGIMAALPYAATLGQLLAVVLSERTGLRKYQFLECALAHRALWLVVAAVPLFLPIPSPWAVWAMLAVFGLSCFLGALSAPPWMTWMGDLIPRRIRGRYFATRSRYAEITKIPLILALGLLLDALTRVDPATGTNLPMTASDQPVLLWSICSIFALSAVLGSLDILHFYRVREFIPSTHDQPRRSVVDISVEPPRGGLLGPRLAFMGRYLRQATDQLLLDPLRDNAFRRYVLFGATVTFALAVAGPYFWRHMLETLGCGQFATDVLFMVLGPISGLASVRGWGRLIDRWGRRPVLLMGATLTVFSVLPYFFSSRSIPTPTGLVDAVNHLAGLVGSVIGQPGWRWLTHDAPVGGWLMMAPSMLIGGCGWSGVMLAQQSIILGFADGHGRSKYVAAHAVLVSVGGVLGGLTGAVVTESLGFLRYSPIVLGPLVWNHWHAAFLLSLLARIAAVISLRHMPDPGARSFRAMAKVMGLNVYSQVGSLVFLPLRVFGWGRRPRQGPKQRR